MRSVGSKSLNTRPLEGGVCGGKCICSTTGPRGDSYGGSCAVRSKLGCGVRLLLLISSVGLSSSTIGCDRPMFSLGLSLFPQLLIEKVE